MTGKDVPMSDTRNDLPLGFSAGAAAAASGMERGQSRTVRLAGASCSPDRQRGA